MAAGPHRAEGPRLEDRRKAVVALARGWSDRPAAARAPLQEPAVADHPTAVVAVARKQRSRVAPP